MAERLAIPGHKQKRVHCSMAGISGGKCIDCTCGHYTGKIVRTWDEAKELYKEHIAAVKPA